jgi:hypothetical protein
MAAARVTFAGDEGMIEQRDGDERKKEVEMIDL